MHGAARHCLGMMRLMLRQRTLFSGSYVAYSFTKQSDVLFGCNRRIQRSSGIIVCKVNQKVELLSGYSFKQMCRMVREWKMENLFGLVIPNQGLLHIDIANLNPFKATGDSDECSIDARRNRSVITE